MKIVKLLVLMLVANVSISLGQVKESKLVYKIVDEFDDKEYYSCSGLILYEDGGDNRTEGLLFFPSITN